MNNIIWTKKQAREYIIKYQMINLKSSLKNTQGVKYIFDRLQTIQYDPLDCVGRNPDLVLQSRITNYKKKYLEQLLYQERYLIDGWDKQMSIFKTCDFPYMATVRKNREKASLASFIHHDIREALDYQEDVLLQIREKGPLFSREIDIENVRWSNGKISSITLDYLFNIGKIIVYNKMNAMKQFEITEKVFNFKDSKVEEKDFIAWYLKRRIKTLGFFWNKGVAWSGIYINKKAIRTEYFEKFLKEGFITKIQVEDLKEPFYVITEYIENPVEIKKEIQFIAPLDNLIWDRELLKLIFNFDYKWEVYVPAKKRLYGYYVLPILYGTEFIGRIEFENHKIETPLVVKNLWFEANVKENLTVKKAIKKALIAFSKYLNATKVICPQLEG